MQQGAAPFAHHHQLPQRHQQPLTPQSPQLPVPFQQPPQQQPQPPQPQNQQQVRIAPLLFAAFDMPVVVDGRRERIQPELHHVLSVITQRIIEECLRSSVEEARILQRPLTSQDVDNWWRRLMERPEPPNPTG